MTAPDDDATLAGLANFLHEVGHLKRTARTGWSLARMKYPESVADHSFRTAVIALVLAAMAGANAERAATIALLHDLPEARLGDINHVTRQYLGQNKPFLEVIEDQVKAAPAEVANLIKHFSELWVDKTTLEAKLAKDADTLDSILHVREQLKSDPELCNQWVQYLTDSIITEFGKQLALSISTSDPDGWWPAVAQSW